MEQYLRDIYNELVEIRKLIQEEIESRKEKPKGRPKKNANPKEK